MRHTWPGPEEAAKRVALAIGEQSNNSVLLVSGGANVFVGDLRTLLGMADWLRDQAEEQAVGSRDFGRGFMHAVEILSRAL